MALAVAAVAALAVAAVREGVLAGSPIKSISLRIPC